MTSKCFQGIQKFEYKSIFCNFPRGCFSSWPHVPDLPSNVLRTTWLSLDLPRRGLKWRQISSDCPCLPHCRFSEKLSHSGDILELTNVNVIITITTGCPEQCPSASTDYNIGTRFGTHCMRSWYRSKHSFLLKDSSLYSQKLNILPNFCV